MLYSNINPEKSYWMGADGFTWWVGQVQGDGAKKLNKDLSISDGPVDVTRSNRVKVRIIGYHSSKWDELPVEDLPWAQIMVPPTTPQSSGFSTSHQLSLGSFVIGFFLDGLNCQQPIIMGVIGDIATQNLKKFTKANLITDNPEQPGFNNTLDPRADNTTQTTGSKGWAAPPNIAQAISYGIGNFDITTGTGVTIYNPGGPSYRDLEMFRNKEKQVSLASPCGTETQEKIDQTLGDMFRFLNGVKKVNDKYVKKYTGEVINFPNKINGFIGRISNIVADILGSVKTLIINKIKQLVRNLINDILNPVAESLIPAREFSDQLLNLVICLVDNILKSLLQFIANIVLSLVENVVNAAFCLVQGVVNSILSAITSAVSGALQAIQGIVSIIGQGGDLIANLASNLADFIASLCAGLGCQIDASRYDMKTGDLQPQSLFGGPDAIINTDFLNIDSPKIFDENGNLIQSTLNCSNNNLGFFPCPPQIALLGLNGDAGTPSIVPVVDSLGRIISTVIKNPGFNITSVTSAIATSCNGYGKGAILKPLIGTGTSIPNLPTLSLSTNPSSIITGQSSTLSWTSTGATSVVFSNFGAGNTTGNITVSPTTTTTYEIQVSGPGGTAYQNVILNVSPIGTPLVPELNLNVEPSNILQGKSATLSWTSTGASSVVFSNFGAGDTNGSLLVNPNSTTTYEIQVSGPGGTASQNVILNVSSAGTGVSNSLVDIIVEDPGIGYSYFDGTIDNINENKVISASSPNIHCAIIGFDIVNVGSGYDENTKILINDIECGIPTIFNGTITSVVSTYSGTKVDSYQEVEVVGSGSGAKIIPIIKCVPSNEAQTLTYQYNIPIEKIDCPGDAVNV